jgi:hypothetical protein
MGNQANDHYAALERLYSERRWAEVEASAEVLLAEADGDLRARVLLLLGHTRLHGFNDAATAAEHYRRVVAAEPEALLLGIAQDGLNQCLAAEGPCPADAMPWLQKIAGPEIAASGAGPAPTSNSAQEAAKETFQSFPGFIQPLETVENLTNSDSPLREASASPAGPSPAEITDEPGTPNQLSPKESAELAKGLLSVVIRPN